MGGHDGEGARACAGQVKGILEERANCTIAQNDHTNSPCTRVLLSHSRMGDSDAQLPASEYAHLLAVCDQTSSFNRGAS